MTPLLTLLATVCSGAWAGETTTIYERGTSTVWSTSDVTTTGLTTDLWYNNLGIKASNLSGVSIDGGIRPSARGKNQETTTAVLTLNRTSNTIVTIDAVWNTGASTADANNNCNSFTYGNFTLNYYTRYSTTNYTLNGTATSLTAFSASQDIKIHIEVNSVDGTISSLLVTNSDASTTYINITGSDSKAFSVGADYEHVTVKAVNDVSSNNTYNLLKSITVQQTTQDVETANVTFKYVDTEGNSLSAYQADQVLENVAVGTTISSIIVSPYTDTFYNGTSNKYVYASSYTVTGDYTEVQDGGNTVTLKFTDYPATAYTVNAQEGGSDIKTGIASGTAYLDGSTTAYWSKYIKVGEQWYVADESTYGAAITSATTNVAYTATDAIDYFFEFEDMSNNSAMLDHTTGTSVSGGNSQRFNANGKNWTTALAGGTYTVNTYCNGNNGKTPTLSMYYCDADGSNVVYIGEATACKASTWELKTTTNVVIPDGKALCFFNNSSYTHNYAVDYITLKRTGDATVSKTMTSAGWATLCSPYALDFSGEIANLTNAYIVTGATGNTLNLTSVKGGTVAANTGILLEGTAGTITIPVAATGTDYSSTNKLKGVTTNTAKDAGTIYVLMSETAGVGFYKNTNAFTVGANTAYLNASDFAAAREFYVFEGETTGINAVKSAENNVQGEVYNLAGQRVAQPTKGLYIVNGKKVVIK